MPAGISRIGQQKDLKMFVCKVHVGTHLEPCCRGKLLEKMFKIASDEEPPEDTGQVQYQVISNVIKIKSSSQVGLTSSICLLMFNVGFPTVGLLVFCL